MGDPQSVETGAVQLQIGPLQLQLDNDQKFPNFRDNIEAKLPPDLIALCSNSERLELGKLLCKTLRYEDERAFKRGTSFGPQEARSFTFRCSREGKPTGPSSSIKNQQSKRVQCPVYFTLHANGNITANWNHCPSCEPESKAIEDDSKVFRSEIHRLHPSLEEELINSATRLWKGDLSLLPRNVSRQISMLLKEKGIANVPPRFLKFITSKGRENAVEGIPIAQSMKKLVEDLNQTPREHYKIVETHGELKSIHIYLSQMAEPVIGSCSVFTADVTHNIIDARSGMKRTSFISCITGRNISLAVVSLIVSEDEPTFMTELSMLLDIQPSLKTRQIIFLVDGDKGRIAAIRRLLPLARVFLCLWHFGPALRAMDAPELTVKEMRAKIKQLGLKPGGARTKSELQAVIDEAIRKGQTQEATANPIESVQPIGSNKQAVDIEEEEDDDDDMSEESSIEVNQTETVVPSGNYMRTTFT